MTRATLLLLCLASPCLAQSNISQTDKFAWSENAGWLNWRDAASASSGVQVAPTFLQGFIWAENVGYINTGNGSAPYANTSGTTFGVNIGPGGYLNGLAWGENIGWVNFDTLSALGAANAARFDTVSQRFRGYAWGENIGWINLDDATSFVSLAPVCCPGDADGSGHVDFDDLTTTLANFGNTGSAGQFFPGDSDCNGSVNFDDLTTTLAHFGADCQ